ncbi:MAG: YeeE/YedE family protein [Saprospiraceae bacterium]|nr:YeeE/YedE family protein [Saprospiraceae bacterium]
METFDLLRDPWPWYIAGPLMGATIPLLLFWGNKMLGASSSLKHLCALIPSNIQYFQYDVRKGYWNIAFAVGVCLGAALCFRYFYDTNQVTIAAATIADLQQLGLFDFSGLMPREIFGEGHAGGARFWIFTLVGGFLVGFGVRYAGGCTSGHGFMGLSQFSRASFLAVLAFFAGGMFFTFFLLPIFLG